MIKELEIVSLRVEKFIDTINNKEYIENEKFIFNCKYNKKKIEVIIWKDVHQNAMLFKVNEVLTYTGISYLPQRMMYISFDEQENKICSDTFNLSNSGIEFFYDKFLITKRIEIGLDF